MSVNAPVKKSFHPFRCRLTTDSAFDIQNPLALVSAGFASLCLAIFTAFRISPMLLFLLLGQLKNEDEHLILYRKWVPYIMIGWLSFILFILIFLNLFLLLSTKIKNRSLILLHPWGLLFLYLDVFVWLLLSVFLHMKTYWAENSEAEFFENIFHLEVYFGFIYIDIFLYFVAYYVFATYFIIAELSALEKLVR